MPDDQASPRQLPRSTEWNKTGNGLFPGRLDARIGDGGSLRC